MYRVLDIFRVADMLSVTLEGDCAQLKNGTILKDENNNIYNVISVAMTRYDNPADISKTTTVLITPCDLKEGIELRIA